MRDSPRFIFFLLKLETPMLSSATASPARSPLLSTRRRPVDMLRTAVSVSAASQLKMPLAASSASPSCSFSSPSLMLLLSCRRQRHRHGIAPFAVPAEYLNDDDEDVSLKLDELDALTDDELADLLAGQNPKGYSEEELLRKVIILKKG